MKIFLIAFFVICSFYSNVFSDTIQNKELLKSWTWPWDDAGEEKKPLGKWDIPNILFLENDLAKEIFGQRHAIEMVANTLLCYEAGLKESNKPIGVFLFAGPTGVGKTELAKALARQIFYDERKLIRIDMSEYHLQAGLNRLIGLPPGYIDSRKGGYLSNALLANPQAIVLLDEIDKTDMLVRGLFLHIFDEGYFTSAIGEHVDCRNCLFIATTNYGAQKILKEQHFGSSYNEILETIESDLIKALTPEFYNRLEPVLFYGLSEEALENIVRKKLADLVEKIYSQRKIYLEFDEEVVEHLKTNGYSRELGARPLQRLFKNQVTSVIAKALITNAFEPEDRVIATMENGAISLNRI